jgi:flagellar assembly factor FliW
LNIRVFEKTISFPAVPPAGRRERVKWRKSVETIKTKAYGEIKVEENSAIYFKREILGFESFRYYYLIEMGDLPNFYWLQSKEEPQLAFIVVDPRLFKSDYELNIDESDVALLEMEKDDAVIDFVIVNIPEDVTKMTINLLGPIAINVNKRVAVQAISLNNEYGTKVSILNQAGDGEKEKNQKTEPAEHHKKEEHKKSKK